MVKKVFISSDIFLSFIDRADPKHLHASAFFRYFAQERYQIFTTLLTLDKTYTTLSESISQSIAKDFMRALSLSNINILYPEESDFKACLKAVLSYNSEITFTETLVAVLCNKRNIPQICTFSYVHPLFGITSFYLPI